MTPAVKPIIRQGTCSVCHGPADELWGHTDWWHNHATDCDGRRTGEFVARIDGRIARSEDD